MTDQADIKPPVGFIGLGNMGTPMVRCLEKAGVNLVVHDLREERAAALAGSSPAITAGGNAADVGRTCQTVVTMLPDAAIVREAATGSGGLAETMAPGGTIIDMSSSAPLSTKALGESLGRHDIALVDAPVSGGVPRAVDATLTIMAGGEARHIDPVEPILDAMGTVYRTGPLGSGHAMKALNNYVSAAGLLAVCEALLVAGEFGLDPAVLNNVLNVSTGRNNTTERKVERHILNRSFDSGFSLDLMCKDVGMAKDLARELGLDAPWLEGCASLLSEAGDTLGPGTDHTAVFGYLEGILDKHR